MRRVRTSSFARAALAIGGGTIGVRALSVLLAMGLGRLLGPDGLGIFFTLMAAAEVAGLLADMGVGVNLSRAVAADEAQAHMFLRDALVVRLGLSALSAALFIGYVILTRGVQMAAPGVILALYIGLNGVMVTLRQWNLGLRRFARAAQSLVLAQLVLTTAGLGLAAAGAGIVGLAIAEVLSAAAGIAFLLYGSGRRGASTWAWEWRRVRTFVGASLPLGFAGLLATVYSRFDIAIVSALAGDVQAGLYGAALQPYLAAAALAGVLFTVAVPSTARARANDEIRPHGPWTTGWVSLALGWFIALTVYALAEVGVNVLYGGAFAKAVLLLQVLAAALPGVFFSNVVMGRAVGESRLAVVLWVGVLGVVTTVGIELVAVPHFGALGAAWATVAVETLIAIALAAAVLRSAITGLVVPWAVGAAAVGTLVAVQRWLDVPSVWLCLPVALGALLFFMTMQAER